jgi:hypothetical protein
MPISSVSYLVDCMKVYAEKVLIPTAIKATY